MKNFNQNLYLAIVYLLCALGFTLLAITDKPLYYIVAILFLVPALYKNYEYMKEKKKR